VLRDLLEKKKLRRGELLPASCERENRGEWRRLTSGGKAVDDGGAMDTRSQLAAAAQRQFVQFITWKPFLAGRLASSDVFKSVEAYHFTVFLFSLHSLFESRSLVSSYYRVCQLAHT
jgi:hypothetical protein